MVLKPFYCGAAEFKQEHCRKCDVEYEFAKFKKSVCRSLNCQAMDKKEPRWVKKNLCDACDIKRAYDGVFKK